MDESSGVYLIGSTEYHNVPRYNIGSICRGPVEDWEIGDPSGGWRQLREGDLRSTSKEKVSLRRPADNHRNLAKAIRPIRGSRVHSNLHSSGDREDRAGWSTDYYELPEGASELQDLIEHRGMNFAIGNIFKAAYRMGLKDKTDREYDLNKIIWFAQRELARLRGASGDEG